MFCSEETCDELRIVMERGNNDLAGILKNARTMGRQQAIPPFTVQHYWRNMLLAVQTIHKEGNSIATGVTFLY